LIPNAFTRTLPGEFHDVDPETLAVELSAFFGTLDEPLGSRHLMGRSS
jgi:hypothetical protein